MNFSGIRPDLVKYEMRQTTGLPAWSKPVKTPGFFGRLLSGIGRFFGAVAAPLSFLFPPAALVAAGSYGAAQLGDQIQYRSYQKMVEAQQAKGTQGTYFPGLQPAASYSLSPRDEMVMDVLFARGDASLRMAHGI